MRPSSHITNGRTIILGKDTNLYLQRIMKTTRVCPLHHAVITRLRTVCVLDCQKASTPLNGDRNIPKPPKLLKFNPGALPPPLPTLTYLSQMTQHGPNMDPRGQTLAQHDKFPLGLAPQKNPQQVPKVLGVFWGGQPSAT